MQTREECFERWKAAKEKRTEVAQQILSRKKKMNRNWPTWVQYDIRAEIALIKRERRRAKADAKQRKQAHTEAKKALEGAIL